MNKIRQTSVDKVNGKLVAYHRGDCLSIDCGNGCFLAAFISEKFNKYYDVTFIEFHKQNKPVLSDFSNGRFFGTRFGSWENLKFAVDKQMIECKYIDSNFRVEKVGSINLISTLGKASYCYINAVSELLENYLEEIPTRLEKTKNAERFPDLAFVSKHLVLTKEIISKE